MKAVSKLPKPCASCPFLLTNHKEFMVVAEGLCKKFGKPKPDFWHALSIRESVKNDALSNGKLMCHSTIYDKSMNVDATGAQPCAGLLLEQSKKPVVKKRSRK